ncbi:LacI family DNA-binding transcriptional regulator [Tengunoibacter tsumagoiensis]|uniref:LacI family transcriptional regulator n=1 Tax=Tengunoibacter tsumagoiensis TaxID=2014871 RepID=A0A402AAB4_9CHLR|nr:LacI family DNA-binding transcriptional regulator [Tengunoibacter tsumagoiensis]GCE16107.1 LacI family transcriptional regulator [Tengunoibacter tsumagoiensis]
MNNQKSSNPISRTIIGDIAERSGVSATTVSRVLNGHKDVSIATRNRVMKLINELGYVPQRNVQTTDLLGMTVPLFNSYFGAIMEGAFDALQGKKAQFLTIRTENNYETETTQVQQLLNQNINGLLFMLPQERAEELLKLKQKGIPFVVVDPFLPLPNEIPTILIENISASILVMEHLFSLGHRRIGIITGPPHWGSTIDRTAGYYAALVSAGLPIDPALICEGRLTPESGQEVGAHLVSLPNPPTAIFAFNDGMAVGAMHAVIEHGLRVPEDISVVGFDDVEANLAYTTPSLTTIHHPLREIGRLAVDVLYRLIQQQPLEATHIKLSARLVIRSSTGPCKDR